MSFVLVLTEAGASFSEDNCIHFNRVLGLFSEAVHSTLSELGLIFCQSSFCSAQCVEQVNSVRGIKIWKILSPFSNRRTVVIYYLIKEGEPLLNVDSVSFNSKNYLISLSHQKG